MANYFVNYSYKNVGETEFKESDMVVEVDGFIRNNEDYQTLRMILISKMEPTHILRSINNIKCLDTDYLIHELWKNSSEKKSTQ